MLSGIRRLYLFHTAREQPSCSLCLWLCIIDSAFSDGWCFFHTKQSKSKKGYKSKSVHSLFNFNFALFIYLFFWLKYIYFTKESKKFRITNFFTNSYHKFDVTEFNWWGKNSWSICKYWLIIYNLSRHNCKNNWKII